jgi:HAD superfamily hydrolase (TIGR01450 family)
VLAATVDALLLDLDGTVYRGHQAIDGVPAVLAELRGRGLPLVFATNNASRTPDAVAQALRAMGVDASSAEVVTSAQAAAALAAERLPAGAAVLCVGGDGVWQAVQAAGLTPVDDDRAGPVAVVQGWGPGLDWRLLAEGAYALARGVAWVATNTDTTLPTERGTAPGNGSFVALLATVTGRTPDVVAGKPHRPLLDRARAVSGGRRPLAVGDRLDTDIRGAVAAGVPSLLVLTGVSSVSDLLAAPPDSRPSYVALGLSGLLADHPAPRAQGEGWACAGWTATVTGGRLDLAGAGAGDDAVRAACAAAWAAADEGRPLAAGDELPAPLRGLRPAG